MINRLVAVLCGSLVATFALTGALADASAAAGSRQYHNARCRLFAGTMEIYGATGGGQLAPSPITSSSTVFCPLVTGSERSSVNSVSTIVSGWANGSTDAITATKCFTRKTGGGGACGTPSDRKTGPGVVTLNPPAP